MAFLNSRRKKRFPTFAVIVLITAIFWLISDMGYLAIDIPWIPLILIIISIGWIFNRFS